MDNYFVIERGEQCAEHVTFKSDNGVLFADLMDMPLSEVKKYPYINEFVATVMESTEDMGGDQAVITLIGPDDVFIWGVLIGNEGDEQLRYAFIDWKADGKSYRYQP